MWQSFAAIGRETADISWRIKQESRTVAWKPHDAAAVPFGLKFVDEITTSLKSSQASKAMLQSSKHTVTKHNLTQNGD